MRILITGGTGFFGRHMTKRLLDEGHIVCVFSRDEAKQAAMRASMDHENARWFVGCVRDLQRLKRAMDWCDVVIHAAALKRIEVGAYAPDEMVKTNILGSMNVIEASAECGVKTVVFLSSDKAYQPISPYGQSKALAESMFSNANNTYGQRGPSFIVTRYGNVVGSTGSVIPTWREQLKHGNTVTVTSPECTRFWMFPHEAVDLVREAMDTPKHLVRLYPIVPKLPAFRLGDLAFAMNAQMKITGLPDWEKMHESMDELHCSETARRMSIAEIAEGLERV